MSIPLPELDDRTWDQLVAESRALIPTHDRSWTDHNPADPGITLIELLAWLTEMLLFRLDRLPDAYYRNFLRLLNGGDWQPGADLEEDLRATVIGLRRRHRAVTAEDYEVLARRAVEGVARSRCVRRRDLEVASEAARTRDMPGHLSVVVVPAEQSANPVSEPGAPRPSAELLETVWKYLDGRRLLTARHHVVGPIYAPVTVAITAWARPGVPFEDPPGGDGEPGLEQQVVAAVTRFLDPLEGGDAGTGWPFGRAVYVSELHRLLDGIEGLDRASVELLAGSCPAGSEGWCVEARELRHLKGDLFGLELADHHLPWLVLVTVEAGGG